jgi:hypothetical protein
MTTSFDSSVVTEEGRTMYRRRRPRREIEFSFDSFLDVVANVVGIVLRLILVAWVAGREVSGGITTACVAYADGNQRAATTTGTDRSASRETSRRAGADRARTRNRTALSGPKLTNSPNITSKNKHASRN